MDTLHNDLHAKFNDSKDINNVWENIKENIKIPPKFSLGLFE